MEEGEILTYLDRIINAFYKSFSSYGWEAPENNHFLMDLQMENEALTDRIEEIKGLLREEDLRLMKERLYPKVEGLQDMNHHYIKKENILFPYLEKREEKFHGLSIMWALHDLVRQQIKDVLKTLRDEGSAERDVHVAIGELFFSMLGVKKKEDLILFPVATEVLSPQDWQEMYEQSLEYDLSFIERERPSLGEGEDQDVEVFQKYKGEGYQFITQTGTLDFEQLLLILNALPVDLTFVDEHDRVRFFTRPKDRIFPRSPAIIGREVKNCHPPDSVHKVNEIVESFRSNRRDQATFWIQLKGRMILIQYFALRDAKGHYRGTLEVSQDITEIQQLKGEKRILDWED